MTKFEDAIKALADQRREHFLTCKPSELIMLALEDLEKVEKLPRIYKVDMDSVHEAVEDRYGRSRCEVCFAGAVLAQTVQLDPGTDWYDDGGEVSLRVWALDAFRSGFIELGLDYLNINLPHNVQAKTPMPDYVDGPAEFKSGLRWISKHLAERGL